MSDGNMTTTTIPSSRSKFGLIRQVTRDTLDSLSPDELCIPSVVETELLEACNMMIDNENATCGHKWRHMDSLIPYQIADAICKAYPIVKIIGAEDSNDSSMDLIAIYQDDGKDKGIYSSDESVLRNLIRQYSYEMTNKDVMEVMQILQDILPRKRRCNKGNLVAVANGLFDTDTKKLIDFDKKYVFLTKSDVPYNEHAKNVVIHNSDDGTDWDVESWVESLSDDPEIVHLIWQILGAILRNNKPWNKSIWMYSEKGNNGKGTLCELMRQLVGHGHYASIPLSDFGKDFLLEPLIRANAIITDENDVGTYIDKAANLKAIITGDTIQINRKFKQPVAFQFHGLVIECVNEPPRIKDKSDSFFRRQIFIPFTKCFTGHERKYIKNEYLKRKDVLEYVLYKVLNMDYDEFTIPESCKNALDEYKAYVDPIREFMEEIMPKVKWDLLPYTFLYDLYVCWYRETHTGDRNIKSQRSFIKDVKLLVENEYPAWVNTDDSSGKRPGNLMDDMEPLIGAYNVEKWMNPLYKTNMDPLLKCHPLNVSTRYRGIYRLVPQNGSDEDNIVDVDMDVMNIDIDASDESDT